MANPSRDTALHALPGLRPLPLLGGRPHLVRFLRDPLTTVRALHHEYGDVAVLCAEKPAMVCLFGGQNNRQVLTDAKLFVNYSKSLVETAPDSPLTRLTTSLPSLNGEMHKRRRRLMMPAFSKGRVEAYRDQMVEVTERYLARRPSGQIVDIASEMTELTMCIALQCLFGLDVSNEAEDLGRLGLQFLEGLTSLGVMALPFEIPGLPYRRFMQRCAQLEARISALIQRKRSSGEETQDLLSILLRTHDEDGGALTDAELLSESTGLFIAGHDTTANTLSWTLFLLSQHPEIYAALVDQLTSVLGGEAPTVEQLSQLPLLDAVIKESMRLLPAAPLLFLRNSSEKAKLDGCTLPPDTTVILSPIISHHAPEIFPEPRRFRPDRWSTLRPSPYDYLPFGAGPRTCIGASFAALELRIALAILLQRRRFTLSPDAVVSHHMRSILMGPRKGLRMVWTRQDGHFARPGGVRGTIHDLVDLS
ncbi:cytochrome P450 [Chondromyces crocatus]|uniref:Cytochrome P450 n=1 Tax=Chondromyces crocatus TaxID=52 RepID=B9ZUJ3_CHOCO|nr:cytochrome P450 [Chondromyces crocatus]AKT41161.1 cytochrome P450 [Chondromyces crocatus]CAQ43072.1 hypothetical protein [Chondromyces crocatus]